MSILGDTGLQEVAAKYVIAADGAASQVRTALGGSGRRVNRTCRRR